ncbi:site-2 protease family protein [Streptomyces sp. NPDC001480]|uniref:site-2 protease family protein n=1 Tax=Streptomyces sp. NPDC001480 TaxID=3364577 RepID=UPI0036A51521
MDVSGASGQPRSGNDEPTEHPAGPTAPATGPGPRQTPAATGRTPDPDAAQDPPPAADEQQPDGTPATHPDTPEPPTPATDERQHDTAGPRPESGEDIPAAPAATPHDEPGGRPAAGRDAAGPPAPVADARQSDSSGPRPESGEDIPAAPAATPHDEPDGRPATHPDTPEPPTPATDERQHDSTPARPEAGQDTLRPHGAPAPGRPHPGDSASRSEAHSGTGRGRPPRRPREPGGGLLMGRPFGVPVYVAPSWFLVAALITWVFGGQLDRVLPELGAARYLVSLFFAVAFYASVLIHELAHTVAALRFKLPVRRIQLQFFGGVSEIEKEAETPGREFVLAFVGPLLSLVLAGLFYLAMLPVEPGTVPGVLLAGLMVSNLIVAAFNLLPGLPLDGGRMLRAVVWKITGKPMSGTIAAAWFGRALAVTVLIGLPLLTQSGALGTTAEDNVGMDTVTDALLAAILAAIIWTGAGNSLRMARLREHLPELRARNLTRRAVPVETDTPLSEALRRANAAGARALVVVDAEGNPLSLVREAAIVGVPEHRRPWVTVSGLAQELTDGMRVSAELAGEDLLDTLRATPATEYLVVEDTGEIYGVLSAADVERAFVKAMARPTPQSS